MNALAERNEGMPPLGKREQETVEEFEARYRRARALAALVINEMLRRETDGL